MRYLEVNYHQIAKELNEWKEDDGGGGGADDEGDNFDDEDELRIMMALRRGLILRYRWEMKMADGSNGGSVKRFFWMNLHVQ